MKFDIKKIFTPKVLTGAAVVGVIATAVIAAKETPKAMETWEKEPEEPVTEKDALKVSAMKVASVAWDYKGTIAAGGLTIACIIGSHKLSMKEIAALTATCGYLATNRDKLETEIRKLPGGEEALKAVKKEVMAEQTAQVLEEEKEEPKGRFWKYQSVEDTGNGDTLCYDHWSGRYFRSCLDAVEQAQCRFNDKREDTYQDPTGDIVTEYTDYNMNDLFEEYGIERTQFGHKFIFPNKRINFINTLIPVERLDPVTLARYDEDLLIIEYDIGSEPELDYE